MFNIFNLPCPCYDNARTHDTIGVCASLEIILCWYLLTIVLLRYARDTTTNYQRDLTRDYGKNIGDYSIRTYFSVVSSFFAKTKYPKMLRTKTNTNLMHLSFYSKLCVDPIFKVVRVDRLFLLYYITCKLRVKVWMFVTYFELDESWDIDGL